MTALTCTKPEPKESATYMKRSNVWPAYHGSGGSFELDSLKLLDALGCQRNKTGHCQGGGFDLMFDLGANVGYFTEKLTVRNFAKNYIMIEANKNTVNILNSRWGNQTWRKEWYSKQVRQRGELQIPKFHIIAAPLSSTVGEKINLCLTEHSMMGSPDGCTISTQTVDHIVQTSLPVDFQQIYRTAQSVFVKIDTEGMDELVLKGMKGMLAETRGRYGDGSPRHLVNFLQIEYVPALMKTAQQRQRILAYNLKTTTDFLESQGFETFLIGPRYIPLSHGSWTDEFLTIIQDPRNNPGMRPDFGNQLCPGCKNSHQATFSSDLFLVRSSHPQAAALKRALGACRESKDFDLHSPHYDLNHDKH